MAQRIVGPIDAQNHQFIYDTKGNVIGVIDQAGKDSYFTFRAANAAAIDSTVQGLSVLPNGDIYTADGTNKYLIPKTNAAGDIVANIVPRTDTLANLQLIVGSQGELASATDTPAIVKYYGTVAGGDVFVQASNQFGTPMASYGYWSYYFNNAGYIYPIDHLSWDDGGDLYTQGLIGFSDISGNIVATFDKSNWFKIMPPVGIPCKYATNGMQIIGVPIAASTSAYLLDINSGTFATWTTMTGALGASQAWNPPVMVSDRFCAVTPVAASTVSAFIPFDNSGIVVPATALPASATWKLVAPQKPANNNGTTYVVAYTAGSAGAINLAAIVPNFTIWVNISVPVAVIAPKILINLKSIIYSGPTQYYSASFNTPLSNKSAWGAAVALNLNQYPSSFVSNGENFFTYSTINTVAGIYQSSDGVTWNKINIGATALTNLIPVACGCIATDDVFDNGSIRTFSILITSVNTWSRIHGIKTVSILGKPKGSFIHASVDNLVLNIGGGITTTNGIQFFADATAAVISAQGYTIMESTIATQASMTVALPPIPTDGQEFKIRFLNAQTSVVFSPQAMPTGTLINEAATYTTAITAKQIVRFTYDLTDNHWYVG